MATAAKPALRKRRMWDVLAALGRPRVAIMLALGISSGLPFALVGGTTLGFWLADKKVDTATIGLTSAVGFAYTVKFVWGAMVDRLKIPFLGAIGRRRSWMIAAQLVVAGGFFGMAATDPKSSIGLFVALTALAACAAALQDTVIDAWRIESAADPDELGLLTSSYSLGFRIALIFTEAVMLMLAKRIDWPASCAICAAAMSIGLVAALLASEPQQADRVMEEKSRQARANPLRAAFDAVAGPLIEFFRHHGLATAALTLGMITLYHISDYGRGPMIGPYYAALGIDKDTIAWVRLALGTPATFAGIALGGFLSLRIGILRSLILGAIVQPIAVGAFAILGLHGGDFPLVALGPVKVTAFETVMAFDSLAMGFAGVALVAYMSTLTSLGYTATQYALLTSALAITGKTLKTFSGSIETAIRGQGDAVHAFAMFYLFCAAIGAPAIVLCFVLARGPRPSPVAAVDVTDPSEAEIA